MIIKNKMYMPHSAGGGSAAGGVDMGDTNTGENNTINAFVDSLGDAAEAAGPVVGGATGVVAGAPFGPVGMVAGGYLGSQAGGAIGEYVNDNAGAIMGTGLGTVAGAPFGPIGSVAGAAIGYNAGSQIDAQNRIEATQVTLPPPPFSTTNSGDNGNNNNTGAPYIPTGAPINNAYDMQNTITSGAPHVTALNRATLNNMDPNLPDAPLGAPYIPTGASTGPSPRSTTSSGSANASGQVVGNEDLYANISKIDRIIEILNEINNSQIPSIEQDVCEHVDEINGVSGFTAAVGAVNSDNINQVVFELSNAITTLIEQFENGKQLINEYSNSSAEVQAATVAHLDSLRAEGYERANELVVDGTVTYDDWDSLILALFGDTWYTRLALKFIDVDSGDVLTMLGMLGIDVSGVEGWDTWTDQERRDYIARNITHENNTGDYSNSLIDSDYAAFAGGVYGEGYIENPLSENAATRFLADFGGEVELNLNENPDMSLQDAIDESKVNINTAFVVGGGALGAVSAANHVVNNSIRTMGDIRGNGSNAESDDNSNSTGGSSSSSGGSYTGDSSNVEPAVEEQKVPETEPDTTPQQRREETTQPATQPKTEPKTQPKTEPKTEAGTGAKTEPSTTPAPQVTLQPKNPNPSNGGGIRYTTGGGETPTTPATEVPTEAQLDDLVDDIKKGNKYKIPTSVKPTPTTTTTTQKSGNGVIPVLAGLSAAAAAGIGAKAYLDRKNNRDNDDDEEFKTEDWSTDSDVDIEYKEPETNKEETLDFDDYEIEQPEKYDARTHQELEDLQ